MKGYKFILNNFNYLSVSIGIVLSVIAFVPFKTVFYAIAVVYMLGYLFSNGIIQIKNFVNYLLFLSAILLSCVYNNTFNIRYIYFICLILVCSPLFSSEQNFNFKIRFLYVFFHMIIFITVLNLFCFFLDVNAAPYLFKDQAANYFSGITIHSMWLSALSGISTIVSFYFFLKNTNRNFKIAYLILVFFSVFVTLVSASRIALVASLIVVLLLLLFYETKKNILKYLILLLSVFVICYPLYKNNLTGLQNKFQEDKHFGVNSRHKLWNARIHEFESSPFFGLGFSSHLRKGKMYRGRMESGSGWLSIVSQTGLLGFFCFSLILKKAIKSHIYIKQNKEILLFYSVFVFLCIHSLAEGYILTPGYYLCFLFWITIDVLVQYDSFENLLSDSNKTVPIFK